jgi:hypothetical protein
MVVPPGSVELGPPSPRGPVFVRPRAGDVGDATAPEEPPPREVPAVAMAPDDVEPAAPPPLSPLPPGVRVPQGEEREVLLARIQGRVISSSSESEESDDAAPTPEEPAVVVVAAPPDDAVPAPPPPLSPLPETDPEAVPPRHKPLQQRVSPRSVLLVPDEQDRTVDIDVYVEDEDEEHLDRLTMLRKRGYLAFYDRPPLMTVALVLSWIFIQNRRGYPPYDEDAYCLGPDTPFKTVFAHAYAHSSREHLYSNVVSMLLVGGVLEAVEGPLCVLCIFACAVPCGAAYHSLWKPHAFVRGASGGVYGVMAAHVSTMLMNWLRLVWKSNFGRPTPSTRYHPTHWLISTQARDAVALLPAPRLRPGHRGGGRRPLLVPPAEPRLRGPLRRRRGRGRGGAGARAQRAAPVPRVRVPGRWPGGVRGVGARRLLLRW